MVVVEELDVLFLIEKAIQLAEIPQLTVLRSLTATATNDLRTRVAAPRSQEQSVALNSAGDMLLVLMTNAMVAQATAAVKVNSKNVVLVQLAQDDQVLVQAVTHDQVEMLARAETHVLLVILVEATLVLLVMTATTADHQVHRATVTNATTAGHQVHRATASNAMTADLLLHVDHVRKAIEDHLVRDSMN